MICDIHTHHHPVAPGKAIVQFTPDTFYPQTGHLYSVGLHPWDIRDDWPTEMAKLLIMALHPQVVMIGETGIDKKNGAASVESQLQVFREHVRLSELVRKPLIIHCVKGIDEVLAVRKELKASLPWVIHGFRGGIEQWRQLSHLGLYVSIGHRHDQALSKELPLSQLFIESDELSSPDIAYDLVSAIRHIERSELSRQVSANIYSLLTDCR